MTHERDNLRDTVQAYRLENETLKTKLAEVNRELSRLRDQDGLAKRVREHAEGTINALKAELMKAREEVEDLKRAYGEVCAVKAAEELGGWLS